MAVLRLWLGAELRRRWRLHLSLALLIGIIGAVILTVAAGARTIDTTASATWTALKPNECLGSPTMFLVNTSQTNSVQPTVTRSHSRSREDMARR